MDLILSFQNHLAPKQVLTRPEEGRRWKCSSPDWKTFKMHLKCNLRVECTAGEDESNCRHDVCNKWGFRVGNRCYMLRRPLIKISFLQAKVYINIPIRPFDVIFKA